MSILTTNIRSGYLVREMGLTPFQIGLLVLAVLAGGPVTSNRRARTVLTRGLEWCAEAHPGVAEEARGLIEMVAEWRNADRERVLASAMAYANTAGGGR